MGPEVILIDSGTAAALEVETYLGGLGLRNDSNQIGEHQYYVSDLPAKFKTIAERFLGTELKHIEKIDIDHVI
jgi:glutamate racemase